MGPYCDYWNRRVKREVKGTSHSVIQAELTPNEYAMATKHPSYRNCIVTEALTKRPSVHVFRYSAEVGKWIDDAGINKLKPTELTGARVVV